MLKKLKKINHLIKKKYTYQLLENGFSSSDIAIGKKVLDSKRITMASYTRNFENSFAKKLGVPHALMVNSGSSANLLALASFNFKKGSEIITPTLTFSTTSISTSTVSKTCTKSNKTTKPLASACDE